MRERMSGSINTPEHESVFGSINENLEKPNTIDRLVDDGFVSRTARRHAVLDIKDLGPDPSIFGAASRIKYENLPKNTWPDGFTGKLIDAATRLEAVVQNCNLNKQQREFASGVKDNMLGTAYFLSEFPQKIKEYLPTKGHIVQKIATADIILTMATACTPRNTTSTPELNIPPQSPASEVFVMERPVSSVPAGSIETFVPTEVAKSNEVTLEDVKNVEPSLKLGIDTSGQLIGLPEGTSQEMIDNVKFYYDLAKERFPDHDIYFDQDVKNTGSFILLAVSPEGKLEISVVSYNESGGKQYSDYSIDFYDEEAKEYKVTGEYDAIEVPGETWGVVWKNGLPRLVANKISLGDITYKNRFQYPTYQGDNPWVDISGVENAIKEHQASDVLSVEHYQIIDGNIQEKEADGWKEVSVPYEAGYISYVELHEGKMYGIDIADRAVVVRNEETGEWEKFDRPVGIVLDGVLESMYKTYSYPPEELLEDVEASEITRLNNNGVTIPWGIIKEDYPYKNYSYKKVSISGYVLGGYTIKDHETLNVVSVFEIPFKYGRQIIVIDNPEYPDSWFSKPYAVPANGNIQESQLRRIVLNEYSKIIQNPKTRGQQIIFVGQGNDCDRPSPWEGCNEYYHDLTPLKIKFYEALKNNEIISFTSQHGIIELYMNESLFSN